MPHSNPTAPERRIDEIGREAFNMAVTSATKAATQEIARIHRIRLITWSAIVTLFICIVMFGIGGVVLYNVAAGNARADARYNCRILTRVAQIMGNGAPDLKLNGQPEGFLSSDTLLRTAQNDLTKHSATLKNGPFKALLNDPATARFERASLQLQRQVTDYWKNTLARALGDVAAQNCAAQVK